MESYKSMLVVIDPTREEQPALTRALFLANQTKAALKIFLAIYDFSYEMTTMLSVDEREAMRKGVINQRYVWIEDMLKQLAVAEDLQTEIKVVWHNRPFEAIIQETIAGGHDIIIKSTHEHDKLKSVIFTPTDWHLLRKSPVPVMLVKERNWPQHSHIMAAISAGNEEPTHASLNEKIIGKVKDLAALVNADAHLVNSYPGTPVNIAIEIPEFDPESYTQTIRDYHEQEMQKLAEEHGIAPEYCHVKEGMPEDVIPQVANDINAELVVLGTVGRTGLSAALIGNTAEHVIDQLDCDVLALKPDGFVSPLQNS